MLRITYKKALVPFHLLPSIGNQSTNEGPTRIQKRRGNPVFPHLPQPTLSPCSPCHFSHPFPLLLTICYTFLFLYLPVSTISLPAGSTSKKKKTSLLFLHNFLLPHNAEWKTGFTVTVLFPKCNGMKL